MAGPFHRVFDGATGEGGLPWEAETGGKVFDPVDIPGLILDLRADVGVTHVAGAISAWLDSASGVSFAQATAADKPQLVTTSFGGRNGVEFDKANTEVLVAAAFASASTSFTLLATVDQQSVGLVQAALDSINGRLIFALDDGATHVAIYDGAFQALATSITGEQVLTFVASAGVGTQTLRGNTSLATDTYAAKSISGACGLGGPYIATTSCADAVMRHLFLYARALSTAEQTAIRTWMSIDAGGIAL